MTLTVEMGEPGVALLVIDALDARSVDAFIDQVSVLVQDRREVNRVAVRANGEPSSLLRHLVEVLDRQARGLGKTVHLLDEPRA